MTNETLHRGFMAEAACSARVWYRTTLGAVLLIEAAAAVALLVSPLGVSRLMKLGDDAGTAWPRIAGLLLLLLVVYMLLGRTMPAAAKMSNILGFVARALLGILLIALYGRLAIVGAVWLVAAIVLAFFYFKYFKAEVMNRP
ncbi:hypothetical protein [Mesorhizobium sp. ES1-3]|uniref:hypothetical protein n=1 Tax=Mesorhizobium sp. ES1-3 TaxID=2876628 RepID=UPI001CCFE84B|nr:hypothetical protein [Mesorhizobium sp. ES1-3]MBZ9673975.1 hypothetical protein [Mesorhizobium sp. ES1-3]